MDHSRGVDHSHVDHSHVDHSRGVDYSRVDHSRVDHSHVDHSRGVDSMEPGVDSSASESGFGGSVTSHQQPLPSIPPPPPPSPPLHSHPSFARASGSAVVVDAAAARGNHHLQEPDDNLSLEFSPSSSSSGPDAVIENGSCSASQPLGSTRAAHHLNLAEETCVVGNAGSGFTSRHPLSRSHTKSVAAAKTGAPCDGNSAVVARSVVLVRAHHAAAAAAAAETSKPELSGDRGHGDSCSPSSDSGRQGVPSTFKLPFVVTDV